MPQIIPEAVLEPIDPAIRRKQVTDHIDELAQLTKQAMADRGLTFPIAFLVPSDGQAILTFASTSELDPTDDEWEKVCNIVIEAAEKTLGIWLVSRELRCALAHGDGA